MAVRRVPSFSSRPGFPAGLRVLLLDCTFNREGCGAQLRQCSYEVTCCSSISEALTAISAARSSGAPFDVLLGEASALTGKSSDCDKLRDQLKDLPTIVMSESPKPEEVMLSIKLGVAEVLERPLCPLKLKNIWQHAVRRMLRTPSSPASRRESAQLDRAGSCRRTSQDLCSSQNGSTTANQEHLLSPVAGSPTSGDLTSASSAMAHVQEMLSKSQLYSPQPAAATPAAVGTAAAAPAAAAAADPASGVATPAGDSRRGSKEGEGEEARRGHKRKSKELTRTSTAANLQQPQQQQDGGSRRGSAEHSNPYHTSAGHSSSSSQNGACAPLDLPLGAVPPFPLGCVDAASPPPYNFPSFPPACGGMQAWPAPALPPGCLPLGQAWGVPLNPMAVAPGITPPIFPTHAPAPMMLPPPQAWPLFPQAGVLPGMPTPNMFGGIMPGLPMPCGGNPFMQQALSGQLPPLPMSMLMGACGTPPGGMCGMPDSLDHLAHVTHHQGMMGSPCSPTPTDPSMDNLSDKSVQDVLTLGFDDINYMGAPQPKMPRCESNQLLPSLEDLIADNDTDMELELESLSLGCLGHAMTNAFKRNDSLDDLINGQSVVAF